MNNSAEISPCNQYRYLLTRCWDYTIPTIPSVKLTWVMLNPSTADAERDDATIRKIIGFSKRWRYGSIMVANLFAYRATNPKELKNIADPVGPDNEYILRTLIKPPIIVGWGASIPKTQKADYLARIIRDRARREGNYFCLGRTKYGEPRHPLMLSYSTKRESWPTSLLTND